VKADDLCVVGWGGGGGVRGRWAAGGGRRERDTGRAGMEEEVGEWAGDIEKQLVCDCAVPEKGRRRLEKGRFLRPEKRQL